MGSTRRDVRAFPRQVRRDIGQALYTAQRVKSIQGETAPRLWWRVGDRIIADHAGNTWRAVYTVRYAEAIYVLHVFQKKSQRGIATPRKDIDLLHHRLRRPSGSTEKGRTNMAMKTKKPVRIEKSGGNVFADLGLPHPEHQPLKAKLTLQIYRLSRNAALPDCEAGMPRHHEPDDCGVERTARRFSLSVSGVSHRPPARRNLVSPTRKEHGEVSFVACAAAYRAYAPTQKLHRGVPTLLAR